MTGQPAAVWCEQMKQRRCVAKAKQTGNRCKRRPIVGGTVCKMHGGGATQVKRSARLRLAELVDPAITTLARAIADPTVDTNAKIRAAEAVLDRAGYPRRSEIDIEDARSRLLDRLNMLDQET